MGFSKEVEMVRLSAEMDLYSCVYVATAEEAIQMAEVGADTIIAHVGTTIGGSIGVVGATVDMDFAIKRTQEIIKAGQTINRDIIFLAHGGPVNTPEDVKMILKNTDAHGFVGASSLERMAVETSLIELTQKFKALTI